MKTLLKTGLLLLMSISLFLSSCAGTYYVSERPAEPVYVRPPAPYDGAFWVEGEWAWNGGRYVYVNGHWDHPKPGHAYIRGYWVQKGHGYVWHHGYWR